MSEFITKAFVRRFRQAPEHKYKEHCLNSFQKAFVRRFTQAPERKYKEHSLNSLQKAFVRRFRKASDVFASCTV